ncbi:thioredoxin [Candidatus Woesearchaeota archaeon]|nr:thioredoxin [Candidatus Woesearchaeota archaeon]
MAIIHLNKENFDKEVVQSKIPVIVDFWASWCRPCIMMAPVFEELSKEYSSKLKFAKISTEEEPNIANKFSITGIPCLIIMQNGKEVDRIIGFGPKNILKQKIDAILDQI